MTNNSKKTSELESCYQDRNYAVILAARLAMDAGYTVGVKPSLDVPEMPVVYLELPTGQVSWMLPPTDFATLSRFLPYYENAWDRHSAEERNGRVCKFLLDWEIWNGGPGPNSIKKPKIMEKRIK